MNEIDELLKDYPVVVTIPVAWGDMDAMQHVNNVVYLRWFESSRVAFFGRIGLHEQAKVTGIGGILHSVQCRYRIPLTYPDTVSAGARLLKIEDDRFIVSGRIVSHQHQKIAAEGEGIVVAFNYREQKKAVWPEELKRQMQNLSLSRYPE